MTDLCRLYGVNLLYEDSKSCYECGYFNESRPFNKLIRDAFKVLLKEIRPQSLNIMESFEIPDNLLQSAIGNSYGDIYETHIRWAQESRLNTTK